MTARKKVVTIVGTRPELIRLSRLIPKLDQFYDHKLIHTGQNFDNSLRDQFFADLGIRKPDYELNLKEQRIGFAYIGSMLADIAGILELEAPDAAVILGDTNSGLAAYVCKQLGIPVFHLEAGNRCYDDKVPEEVNRRVIDASSDWLLTYTQRSREQLLREGYHPSRVIVIGNPITEVLRHFVDQRDITEVRAQFEAASGAYMLATLHRAENVSVEPRLRSIVAALNQASAELPVILSVHPKLDSMLGKFGIELADGVKASPAFDFSTFAALMSECRVVVSDSGTVPEEAAILDKPCVLLRDSTERPELLENNSMVVSGVETDSILAAVDIAIHSDVGSLPRDYEDTDVSSKVVKILSAINW